MEYQVNGMGISPFSNCTSSTVYITNGTGSTRDGNPNKYKFKILQRVEFGKYLVVKINYPDCTNYTGDKILVYGDRYKFDKLLKSGAVPALFKRLLFTNGKI